MLQGMLAKRAWKQGNFEQAAGYFEGTQQWQEAAGCLEVSGKHLQAAKLYMKVKNMAAAARCFEAAGRWSEAAKCHEKLKNWRGLARCYEQMADFVKAAESYERAGSLLAAARSYERAHYWHFAIRTWNGMGRLDEAGRCQQIVEQVEKCLELVLMRTDQLDLEAIALHNDKLLEAIQRFKDDNRVDNGLSLKDVLFSLLIINNPESFSMVIQDGRTLLFLGMGVYVEETNVRMLLPDAQAVIQARYPKGVPVEL